MQTLLDHPLPRKLPSPQEWASWTRHPRPVRLPSTHHQDSTKNALLLEVLILRSAEPTRLLTNPVLRQLKRAIQYLCLDCDAKGLPSRRKYGRNSKIRPCRLSRLSPTAEPVPEAHRMLVQRTWVMKLHTRARRYSGPRDRTQCEHIGTEGDARRRFSAGTRGPEVEALRQRQVDGGR
jgi:hypothetical protein